MEAEEGVKPWRNLDLIVHGVEYLELARFLNGIEFAAPSPEEVGRVRAAIGGRLDYNNEIRVIASGGKRFLVAAWAFQEMETDRPGGVFWGPDGYPLLDNQPPGEGDDVGPRFGGASTGLGSSAVRLDMLSRCMEREGTTLENAKVSRNVDGSGSERGDVQGLQRWKEDWRV
jgi:hypothetical protein